MYQRRCDVLFPVSEVAGGGRIDPTSGGNMSRTSLKLLVLAATVVALGAMASLAQADSGPVITTGPVGQPPVALPLCKAVTAHAHISAHGPTTSASSNGNAYYYSPQGLCRRYVVGVGTPSS